MKNDYIDKIVTSVRNVCNTTKDGATDLEYLLEILNGKVEDATLPEYTDAQLIKEKLGFSIKLNKDVDMNNAERNLCIAHEIGHLLMHASYDQQTWNETENGTPVFAKRRNIVDELSQEIEADKFAYALIMPTDLFIKKVEENREGTDFCQEYLSNLAKYFNTSEKHVVVRGRGLGIW